MTAVAYASTVETFTPTPPPVRSVPPPAVIPRAYRRRRALGNPTPLACTVSRTSLEVALGAQGIDKLTRWITPTLRASLLKQSSLAKRAQYLQRGPVSVTRVRVCRVSPSAVEAALVLTEGDIAHPVAMRLEECAGRWLVTALELG